MKKILRKSIKIGENVFNKPKLLESTVVPAVVETLGGTYTEMERNYEQILKVISYEDEVYKELQQERRKALSEISLTNLSVEDVIDYPDFVTGYRAVESMLRESPNERVLSGEMMYQLHRSHGFDKQFMIKLAESKGLVADVTDYDRIIQKEKEKSKASMAENVQTGGKFERFSTLPPTDNDIKYTYKYDASKQQYAIPKVEAKVLAIAKDARRANAYNVVLDRSNFYFTAGGQDCDNGQLRCNGATFQVDEVSTSKNDVVVHTGVFLNGSFAAGESVTVEVDAKIRSSATHHHTGIRFCADRLFDRRT